MKFDVRSLLVWIGAPALAATITGCTCSESDTPKPAPSALPVVTVPEPAQTVNKPPIDHVIRLPSGPALEILPGQGVGAIRLGATAETIERLMGAPCEIKTEHECGYIGRAVEFLLDDQGATKEIKINRLDRPAPEGRTFGVFNGRMANGLTLTMIPSGVQYVLGPPKKVEEVKDGGSANTVQIAHYDGLRIEYDKVPPDRIEVGGIIVTKGSGKPPAAPSAPKGTLPH
jgi:hypothetical protein